MKTAGSVLLSALILAGCGAPRPIETVRHIETIELSGRISSKCGECGCVIMTKPARALDMGYYDVDVDVPADLAGQRVRLNFITDWSVFEKIPAGARITVRVNPTELEPDKAGHREASIRIREVVWLIPSPSPATADTATAK